mgnify:CR=1 FL=1
MPNIIKLNIIYIKKGAKFVLEIKINMKKEFETSLINGVFDNKDTADILLSMLNKKIEYHELRSFSNLIKFNEKDISMEDRIEELKKARQLDRKSVV